MEEKSKSNTAITVAIITGIFSLFAIALTKILDNKPSPEEEKRENITIHNKNEVTISPQTTPKPQVVEKQKVLPLGTKPQKPNIVEKPKVVEPKPIQTPEVSNVSTPKYGTFKDIRDGKIYETVQYNGKTWLSGFADYEVSGSFYVPSGEYRIYSWEAAMKSVPKGWRLPTKKEYESLVNLTKNDEDKSFAIAKGDLHLKGKGGRFVRKGNENYEYYYGSDINDYFWSCEEQDILYAYVLLVRKDYVAVTGFAKYMATPVKWVKE